MLNKLMMMMMMRMKFDHRSGAVDNRQPKGVDLTCFDHCLLSNFSRHL